MRARIQAKLFMIYLYAIILLKQGASKIRQLLRRHSGSVTAVDDRRALVFGLTLLVVLVILADFLAKHTENEEVVQSRAPNGKRSSCVAKIFILLIGRANREHVLGDLEEEYREIILPQYGARLAWAWYWWQMTVLIGFYSRERIRRTVKLEIILKLIGK